MRAISEIVHSMQRGIWWQSAGTIALDRSRATKSFRLSGQSREIVNDGKKMRQTRKQAQEIEREKSDNDESPCSVPARFVSPLERNEAWLPALSGHARSPGIRERAIRRDNPRRPAPAPSPIVNALMELLNANARGSHAAPGPSIRRAYVTSEFSPSQ